MLQVVQGLYFFFPVLRGAMCSSREVYLAVVFSIRLPFWVDFFPETLYRSCYWCLSCDHGYNLLGMSLSENSNTTNNSYVPQYDRVRAL